MAAQVTVVIVSWNTRSLLERSLTSFRESAERGLVEVWVVDNGSVDGSRELVRSRFPWVTMLEPDENLGFGRAVNLVAAQTKTPWIAPANADVAAFPSTVDALLEAGRRHREAGAIAPSLESADGSVQRSVHAFPTVRFALLSNLGICDLSRRLGDRYCTKRSWDPRRPREVDWAHGAFLLVRREAWDAVGGFMDDQWMYAEDLDLGWRLARAGWKTRYAPEARMRHEARASTRQAWGAERTDRWMRAMYAWLNRRRGPAVTRLIAAINVAGAAGRWLLCGLLAVLLRSVSWRRRRDLMAAWAWRHTLGLRPDRVHPRA